MPFDLDVIQPYLTSPRFCCDIDPIKCQLVSFLRNDVRTKSSARILQRCFLLFKYWVLYRFLSVSLYTSFQPTRIHSRLSYKYLAHHYKSLPSPS